MKVELKPIIDQLSDALDFDEKKKVAALVDDEKIVGWTVVDVQDDGTLIPSEDRFTTLKELFNCVYEIESKNDRK